MNTTNTMQMEIPFVDLASQYQALQTEVGDAIANVLQRRDFILGRDVGLFEEQFAAYCETQYAIGVDSGLSALQLGLQIFDIGQGDEVITAANTFIATALAISHTGAKPVLVDIDPETYNIDPRAIEAAITPNTKAIVPVHLYGQPADMDAVMEIAQRHGLVVIEDACQAHGARYKGKRAGSLGHLAAFSFYPGKNLGAYGDGGIIVTSDPVVAERARILRNYGQREKYHHVALGYNRRLDTLQAAVLITKLRYLDAWNDARRESAKRYEAALKHNDIIVPTTAAYAESVWHLYVIRVNDRESLQKHLATRGIATGIHYPIPIHLQPAYEQLGYVRGDFPITERYADEILSLPMFPELTAEAVEYIAEAIVEFEGKQMVNLSPDR